MHRKRQLTSVFLPEKSHGQRSPAVTKCWTRLSDWACICPADLLCVQEKLTHHWIATILQQKLIIKRRGQIQSEEPILRPYWKRQSFLLEKHCSGYQGVKELHSRLASHLSPALCFLRPPHAVASAPNPSLGCPGCLSLDLLQIIPTSGLGNPFPSVSSHHTSQTRLLFVCSVTLSCPTLCDPMDCCFQDPRQREPKAGHPPLFKRAPVALSRRCKPLVSGLYLAFYVNQGIQPLFLLYFLNCKLFPYLSLNLYISLASLSTLWIPWTQPGLDPGSTMSSSNCCFLTCI